MATTRAELIELLSDRDNEIARLKEALNTEENKSRSFKRDAEMEARNSKEAHSKLYVVCQVITASLQVKHGVGLVPKTEYFQGRDVETEQVTEEIRLLRHLHELASTDAPF
ncbi:hypothetical protein [Novipirellula rosea]|uniref:Uncharacterized protein n=1 Tax=Novipirellula rosea TaxID=1031540 RepID=A0ABP8ND76_9BACT